MTARITFYFDFVSPNSYIAALGIGADEMMAAADDEAAAAAAMAATEAAIEVGAFGVPYMVVDGAPFWGQDRLAQLDWWLERNASQRLGV